MKNLLKWTLILLGGVISLVVLGGLVLYPSGVKKLSRTYPGIPVETVNIPTDPDAVARGKHIAIVWRCTECHGKDLSGMLLTNDAILGTIPAANLTAGKGGIGGSYTDTDWIRALRHGIKPDNQGEIFMYDYSSMSDLDLGDLIAYLKQIPSVDTEYPAIRFGPIIPIAPVIGLFTPAAGLIDHETPHPMDPAPGATIEYGKYLSAICFECHSSNLAGKLEGWSKEDFARAVRTDVLPNGRQLPAAMSSKTFGELNDMELTALWLYLQSLPPAMSQK